MKKSFNESVEICEEAGMTVLSNRDPDSYQRIIEMENHGSNRRKVVWIGARQIMDRKWIWLDSGIPDW